MNVAAADNAGILKLKMLVMENIDMFRHPKYYKELRKRNKSDQVISESTHDGESERAPGPGLKPKETSCPFDKPQAGQDARRKPQVPRHKPQASSHKRQAP